MPGAPRAPFERCQGSCDAGPRGAHPPVRVCAGAGRAGGGSLWTLLPGRVWSAGWLLAESRWGGAARGLLEDACGGGWEGAWGSWWLGEGGRARSGAGRASVRRAAESWGAALMDDAGKTAGGLRMKSHESLDDRLRLYLHGSLWPRSGGQSLYLWPWSCQHLGLGQGCGKNWN